MPRTKDPARVVKWRGAWYLFWFDHASQHPRRSRCSALGAHTTEQRRELEREYRSREFNDLAEVKRRGGLLAYDTVLTDALDQFLEHVDEQAKARAENPEARLGVAPSTARELRDTVAHFQGWLKESRRPRITTGQLDSRTLESFFLALGQEATRRGKREIKRSASTLNKYRRQLRVALRWLARLRPPLFPDFDPLAHAFRPAPTDPPRPTTYPPDQMATFLRVALNREVADRTVKVRRLRQGHTETFEQTAPSTSSVPVSRLFLLLALTGARRGEVLGLRWADVDLASGRITLRSGKTGRSRILPIAGAPEGTVAPRLLQLIKSWHLQSGGAEYVLSSTGTPRWPANAWRAVSRECGFHLNPQRLRQNFCGVAASMGVPSAIAALWQGHAAAIADKWYRELALNRLPDARDFEEALGLAPILDQILTVGSRAPRHQTQ